MTVQRRQRGKTNGKATLSPPGAEQKTGERRQLVTEDRPAPEDHQENILEDAVGLTRQRGLVSVKAKFDGGPACQRKLHPSGTKFSYDLTCQRTSSSVSIKFSCGLHSSESRPFHPAL